MNDNQTQGLLETARATLPANEEFVVGDRVALGTRYGDLTVTYVGPNFLRIFGDVRVPARPERTVGVHTVRRWATDAEVAPLAGDDGDLADLFALLELGVSGPGEFDGESNTVYSEADGRRWTPHFYTRGKRLGFGALPFGDAVGWEPGDIFVGS